MKVIVYHTGYGCDTGCCGHAIDLEDENGKTVRHMFSFDHPDLPSRVLTDEKTKEFLLKIVTEEFGAEHCVDIDFDECIVSGD